jgi:DNA-binding NtrC family response regulator
MRKMVIIIDDSAIIRAMLENILCRKYNVIAFPNGQLALDHMRDNIPCLVISDLNMPIMGGYELIREVKKMYRHVPCILLTSEEGANVVTLAKEAGAATCLKKPFNERAMTMMVRMVIGE